MKRCPCDCYHSLCLQYKCLNISVYSEYSILDETEVSLSIITNDFLVSETQQPIIVV